MPYAPEIPPLRVKTSAADEISMVLSAVSVTGPAKLLVTSASVPPASVTGLLPTLTP